MKIEIEIGEELMMKIREVKSNLEYEKIEDVIVDMLDDVVDCWIENYEMLREDMIKREV